MPADALASTAPEDVWHAARGALVAHRGGAFFGGYEAPIPSPGVGVAFPFRVGVRDNHGHGWHWVPLRVLVFQPDHDEPISDTLAKAFVQDIVEQISRYERGEPFECAPLRLPAPRPHESIVQAALIHLARLMWGTDTEAVACIGERTWPLVPGCPASGLDPEAVVHLGKTTLVSKDEPCTTISFLGKWRAHYSDLAKASRSASTNHPSLPLAPVKIGHWFVTYDGSVRVEYDCGRFLLQDDDGAWYAPAHSITVHCTMPPSLIAAVLDGVIPPETMLRNVRSEPACHPHVSGDGNICYGGNEARMARQFRATGNQRPTSLVLWALLTAAWALKRGHLEGATNFRSLSEAGWHQVSPTRPEFARLPRYPYRRPKKQRSLSNR